MNSKDINNMLSDFTASFNKFREDFHNITNEIAIYEMNQSSEPKESDFINSRIEELDKLIDEVSNEEITADLPADEKEYREASKNSKLEGLKQEKEYLEGRKKALDKNDGLSEEYLNTVKGFRESLVNSIDEVRASLQEVEVNGKKKNKIDVILNALKIQLDILEYRMASLKAEIDKANWNDREPLLKEMKGLTTKRDKFTKVMEGLSSFMVSLDELERKHKNANIYVDVFEIQKYDGLFEELADVLNSSSEKAIVSINVIKNEDGSYSLDMRCGNKIAEPRPNIAADKFNEKTINQYLDGFIYSVASKSDLSIDDLKKSEIIVKNNDVELGKFDYKDVAKNLESKVETTVSEEKTEEPVVEPTEEPVVEPTEEPVVEPTEEPDKKDEPVVNKDETKTPEEPKVEGGQPSTTQEPESKEEITPTPVIQTSENDINDIIPTGKTEEQDNAIKEHIEKVNNARAVSNKVFNIAKTTLGVAACGLGLAGVSLGGGLLPAATMLGGFAFTSGIELACMVFDNIKYNSTIRKLKAIARKNKVKFDFNPEQGICRFVSKGADDKQDAVEINSTSVSGISDAVLESINNDLKDAFDNDSREKGDDARTLKEINRRYLPKVTANNLAAAFIELGGIKTKKERKQFKLGELKLKEIFDRNKKSQAKEDDTLESNVTAEELEAMTNSAEATIMPEATSTVSPEVTTVVAPEVTTTKEDVVPVVTDAEVTQVTGPVVETSQDVVSLDNMSAVDLASKIDEPVVKEDEVDAFINSVNGAGTERNLTDEQLMGLYRKMCDVKTLGGEARVGEELTNLYSSNAINLSKADYEKLQEIDVNKEFFTDETKEELFGKGLEK